MNPADSTEVKRVSKDCMCVSNLSRSEAADWSRGPTSQTEFSIDAKVCIRLGEYHRRPDLNRLNLMRRLTLNAIRGQGLLQPDALGDQHHLNDEVCG